MTASLRLFVTELIHRAYHRPRRTKHFQSQSGPFESVSPDGLRFMLEPGELIDHYIAVDGIYERRYLRFFKRALPVGAVMIDIGANIGNHALYLHDGLSAVHCFEPNPRAATRLRQNIALNQATNVHVHQFGLGHRDALLPFATNVAGNLGNSGFFSGEDDEPGKFEMIELPIRQADAVIEELDLKRIDLIKIDVEGLEEEVFQGLRQTIERFRPLVAFELHAHLAPPATFERISACLPDYTIADLSFAPEGSGRVGRIWYHLRHGDQLTLRAVETPKSRTYECLFAVPNEHPLARSMVRSH